MRHRQVGGRIALDEPNPLIGCIAPVRQFGQLHCHQLRLPIRFCAAAQLALSQIVQSSARPANARAPCALW